MAVFSVVTLRHKERDGTEIVVVKNVIAHGEGSVFPPGQQCFDVFFYQSPSQYLDGTLTSISTHEFISTGGQNLHT